LGEDVKVDVLVQDETIWLTQKAMAALFGVQIPAINKHLKNIFNEGELDEQVVNSAKATQFRIWAFVFGGLPSFLIE
jgi:hypothetical protein